jgi:hypothetical protein
MKTFLALFVFCMLTPLKAADFDTWYFDFHSEPVVLTGKLVTPDGAEIATVTGERTGKPSADGKSFEEISNYIYEPGEHKSTQSIVWKKSDKDGEFTGTSHDPSGIEISYRMKIDDKSRLTIKSKSLDGRASVDQFKLDAEGKIQVTGSMRSKAGDVMFEMKYTLSKGKK